MFYKELVNKELFNDNSQRNKSHKGLILKRIRQATYSSQIDSKPVLWDKFIVCVIFLHFHIFRRRINREKVEILKTRYC